MNDATPVAAPPSANPLFSPGKAPWGVNRIYWEQDQKRAAGLLPRTNGTIRGFVKGNGP